MTPITYLKALGVTLSFLSFMLFTYAKTTKNADATMKVSSSLFKSGVAVASEDTVVRSKI